jgi:dsDNA-specific endonuclease/ATPase MutS2
LTDEPVEVPIEDWIDLHTFPPPEIKSLVEEYLYQAVLRGYSQIRIIHGRGIGVQREIVRKLLSRNPAVTAFEDTPDRGATVVYLKHPH